MSATALSRLACMLAALAIILGAMGAHGKVHDVLLSRGTQGMWETGVFYHLIHAVVLWALAGRGGGRMPSAAWFFIAGIVCFSGSLYGLSLARIPALGPVTPLGGLGYIAGWVCLAVRPARAAV